MENNRPNSENITSNNKVQQEDPLYNPQSVIDLDELWSKVQRSPLDFKQWEQLIQLAESKHSVENDTQTKKKTITNIKNVYFEFLNRFPLCFGYWLKFANLIYALTSNVEETKQIYEKAVNSFPNSVDLWTSYCSFLIQQNERVDIIREKFEKGAHNIGNDFMLYPFWDKYIEFEEGEFDKEKLFELTKKLIKIPNHQYAKYFEKYKQLCLTIKPIKVLKKERYDEINNQARKKSEQENKTKIETDLAVKQRMRSEIEALNSALYDEFVMETNNRWKFEAEIKRSYYHVKPLDKTQLDAWHRYIDYEEKEFTKTNNSSQVNTLYERCLISCACYEEFWIRYVEFLLASKQYTNAIKACIKAERVHLALEYNTFKASRPKIRILHAFAMEVCGKTDASRSIYHLILQNSIALNPAPQHIMTIRSYLQFEKRVNPQSYLPNILKILESGETYADDVKIALSVDLFKYYWKSEKNIPKAESHFNNAISQFRANEYLWATYVEFVISQSSELTVVEIQHITNKIIDNQLDYEFSKLILENILNQVHERSKDTECLSIMLFIKESILKAKQFIDETDENSTHKRSLSNGTSTQKNKRTNSVVTSTNNSSHYC